MGNLGALYKRVAWVRDEDTVARCIPKDDGIRRRAGIVVNPEHHPPEKGCGCGLWGCYARRDIVDRHIASGWTFVYGAALGYGEVAFGEVGMRFERATILAVADDSKLLPARVVSLADCDQRYRQLAALAARYGVALIPWGALEAHAGRFGEIVDPRRLRAQEIAHG